MGYNRGERMKLNSSLTPREKRSMIARLTTAAEAEEEAREAKEKLMGELWERGMPLSAIMGGTGIGYETTRRIIKAQGYDIDPE